MKWKEKGRERKWRKSVEKKQRKIKLKFG